MSPGRAAITPRSPTNRSRVTNGHALLPGVDGRSALARRYHDLVAALVGDAGGIELVSETRLQLIRRFSALASQAEGIEARAALGEPINLGEFALISSTMVRLASRLGLDRRTRDLTPTIEEYARLRERQPEEAPP
jgi:hypothetical protein